MATEQRTSEAAIRAVIERWATAVHARDLDGVLADHSEDIQMFDVPPPNAANAGLKGNRVAAITGFPDTSVFRVFGLPRTLRE